MIASPANFIINSVNLFSSILSVENRCFKMMKKNFLRKLELQQER